MPKIRLKTVDPKTYAKQGKQIEREICSKMIWNWKKDPDTEKYLESNKDIERPGDMTNKQLAEAVSHIKGLNNPYARLLCARADKLLEYDVTVNVQDKENAAKILSDSASRLGVKIA